MSTTKEAYNVSEGSPVFEKWPTGAEKVLAKVYHFNLKYYYYRMTFLMITFYKHVDGGLYRDRTGIGALHKVNYDFDDFERHLRNFINKVKRYTNGARTPLSKQELKQIREYFRNTRKEAGEE
jgi:hypothetical protein